MKSLRKEVFSIPNIMGYFRIILIPVFLYIYYNATSVRDYYIVAGIVFISGITDFLDGYIARNFNMIRYSIYFWNNRFFRWLHS